MQASCAQVSFAADKHKALICTKKIKKDNDTFPVKRLRHHACYPSAKMMYHNQDSGVDRTVATLFT